MEQMDSDANETYYITLGGHVELHRYRYLYFVVMFVVYVLIMCSNFTIVFLIATQQSLHEPMYVFIAALLLNSALFSTVIYPKLLIDFLSERQVVSPVLCTTQGFFYYSLGASEVLLLAAMAFDRYVSICKPLQYPTIMRKPTLRGLLAFAWLFPAVHLTPSNVFSPYMKLCKFTLPGIYCNNAIFLLQCEKSKFLSTFGLFTMMNTLVIPFAYIIFTYVKILVVSHRSSREVKKKAAQTCVPHLLVLFSFSCLCTYDVTAVRVQTSLSSTAHLIMTVQVVLYHPLFNPIVYGLKMKEISKQLKKLLCRSKPTHV
ncbi:unnamed protein product [Ophioblennius macclurei]